MSKVLKFLSLINKNPNVKIVYKNNSDILNGEKNLQDIINATKFFCDKKNVYVEIGTFRGFTLIHNSIYNKNTKIIGIDNFSIFDKLNQNFNFIKSQIKKHNLKNIFFLKKDYQLAHKKINNKIGVLFVDGAHDYRSTLLALLKYSPLMSKEAIILVDDSNYYHVRKATSDFLDSNKDFQLIHQKYTNIHLGNANKKTREKLIKGIWNGINILYKGPNFKKIQKVKLFKHEKILERLFYETHETFRHKYAFNVNEILDLIYDYNYKIISRAKFLSSVKKISVPKELKNLIKYKSRNLFP
tara:strand:- start:126 stop:1022 length:897 start_codon:yes stop_codon:yes gene_type:complete